MTATTDPTGTDPTKRPGRLGDPTMSLRTDPRTDPRTITALAPFGLDVPGAPPPVGPGSLRAEQLEFVADAEAGFEAFFAALVEGCRRSKASPSTPRRSPDPGAISRST